MKKTEQNRKKTICILLAILLIVGTVGVWMVRKEGFFLDEIYSYGLSNSHYKPFLTTLKPDGITGNVFTRDELMNYVSVSETERFDYGSVYYNQTQDVHPPLFYFLLNTVCSLFPGSFTKWTGLALNGVLFLGTLAALYALCMELFADWKKSIFTCMLYAFSREAHSDVLMIRMYMLLTFLTVLLALLVAKSIHKPTIGKYLLIGVTIYLGMLTQYFYVVYAFLLCAAYDIYLLYHRQWKNVVCFSVPALAGVGGMLLTFPCWYAQLNSQTDVSLNTVTKNAGDILQFPISIATMFQWNFISFWAGCSIFVLMILAAVAGKAAPGRFTNRIRIPTDVKLVTFPVLVAFAVISIIAPYKVLRYAFHLQPVEAVLFGHGFFELIRPVTEKQKKRFAAIVLAAAFAVSLCMEPEYTYSDERDFNKMLRQNENAACVLLSKNQNPTMTASLNQLLIFRDVCAAESFSDEALTDYLEQRDSDTLVLFVATYPAEQADENTIETFCEENGYKTAEKIAEKEFSKVYLLQKTAA